MDKQELAKLVGLGVVIDYCDECFGGYPESVEFIIGGSVFSVEAYSMEQAWDLAEDKVVEGLAKAIALGIKL